MGEIKQKIATMNGEINNDLFLINLLLLYKLNLSLFILHIPPPRGGGGGVYLYWLWYKGNVIFVLSMIFSSPF